MDDDFDYALMGVNDPARLARIAAKFKFATTVEEVAAEEERQEREAAEIRRPEENTRT